MPVKPQPKVTHNLPYYTVSRVADVALSSLKALKDHRQREIALGRILAGMRIEGVSTMAILQEADAATNHYHS